MIHPLLVIYPKRPAPKGAPRWGTSKQTYLGTTVVTTKDDDIERRHFEVEKKCQLKSTQLVKDQRALKKVGCG